MDLTLIRSASLFYFPWGGAIAASQLLVDSYIANGSSFVETIKNDNEYYLEYVLYL